MNTCQYVPSTSFNRYAVTMLVPASQADAVDPRVVRSLGRTLLRRAGAGRQGDTHLPGRERPGRAVGR